MKTTRLLLCAALLAWPRLAAAQATHPTPSAVSTRSAPSAPAAPSAEARAIFAALKSLNGSWIGPVVTIPDVAHPTITDTMRATLRVLSRGNTLVHEMKGASLPEDPSKYDHPVTVIYLNDDGKLTLTHYCDAGNRPRMTARISPDGKTVDFDFVDISGRYDRTGHMQHATFTLVDADHHVEDWTYLMPNNQTVRAHIELHREPVPTAAGGR